MRRSQSTETQTALKCFEKHTFFPVWTLSQLKQEARTVNTESFKTTSRLRFHHMNHDSVRDRWSIFLVHFTQREGLTRLLLNCCWWEWMNCLSVFCKGRGYRDGRADRSADSTRSVWCIQARRPRLHCAGPAGSAALSGHVQPTAGRS